MFVLGFLFKALASLSSMIIYIATFLLVIRIILSWLSVDPYNDLVRAIYSATEPMLAPLRRLPLQIGMIDLSPIAAFIILKFLESFLVGVLYELAIRCGVR